MRLQTDKDEKPMNIDLTITSLANTWTQADQDHLVTALGKMEMYAYEAVREKDEAKRRALIQKLSDQLETAKEIQFAAQNSAHYIAERLHMLKHWK